MEFHVTLGATPCDEPCEQVGPDFRPHVAQAECERFIALIRSKVGPEPNGAKLKVKWFSHDFGRYPEVIVVYDENNPEAEEFAWNLEANVPTTWE
jgi:hypothetical protein